MRVYIPATVSMLEGLIADGRMPARGGTAFAVTPALREAYTAGDEDELAHVAFLEAARASIRLLAAEIDGGSVAGSHSRRRCVVSVDVPDAGAELRPDLDEAVVRLAEPLIRADSVAAVHVDLAGAEVLVARAAEVIDAADLGDEDAELAVGDAEDHELAWYDPIELPFLLELL